VPLRGVSESDGALTVPYEKETVKNAPQVEHDGALSKHEEAELHRHYGVE
jgi:hypothetical protein